MEYITIKDASKIELMRQLSGITNSGKLVDNAFKFITSNKDILDEGEFVIIRQEFPKAIPGIMNYMTLDTKYSINVKRSLVILVMLLLDINFTKGFASTGLGLTGFASQTIHKIAEKERCILLDTLIGNKSSTNDYLYYKKECVQNDIECSFRNDGCCTRGINDIEKLLDELINKEIIVKKEGQLRLTF